MSETPLTDAFEQELYADDSCLVTEPEFERMLEFCRKLERKNVSLKRRITDIEEDAKASAVEARWQERQGEDYGSY